MPRTVKSYLSGVQSFYRCCDTDLPTLSGSKAKTLEKNKDIPTKEDLQEVLKICDPLEKYILLVGVSSGLSSNKIQKQGGTLLPRQ
jgi:hypothetical protein